MTPPRNPKRCPACSRPLKSHYTLSVSAEAYAWMKAAAEAKGWSLKQLVEEACADV